jgi:hypothetical protein
LCGIERIVVSPRHPARPTTLSVRRLRRTVTIFGHGKDQPPAFLGGLFVILGSSFILLGWTFAALVLVAGRCISRRKHYTFCFIMACVECLSVPFGTVLGVFTILVLNRASVKELFNPKPAA